MLYSVLCVTSNNIHRIGQCMSSLEFSSYISKLRLSEVKHLLLKALWGSNSNFPKPWVKSSHLLKISNQKYFDRRLRELRDSAGLDIESKVIDGEHCWRLSSSAIAKSNDRTYLTASQKATLFRSANNRCAVCGKVAEAGMRGLQADHKRPLIKGGGTEFTNWQALCNECNVAKRGTCKDCELDCNSCAWAFPEKVGFNYVVKLPSELKQMMETKGITPDEVQTYIIDKLSSYIKSA